MGSNAVADDNDLDVSAQLACQRDQAAASERLVVWMRSDDHDAASPEDLIQIGYGECVGACEEFVVFDLWAERWRRREAAANMIMDGRTTWPSSFLRRHASGGWSPRHPAARIAARRLSSGGASPSKNPLPFHKMTESHQRADAVADDLGDCEHWR